MTTFEERVGRLPRLGVGLSGEFNIAAKGMDVNWMKERYPGLAHFYEYGCYLDRSLDEGMCCWAVGALMPVDV
ncbi:MAG: hypothetical protein M3X11_08545 [Acidobacteriota bacterium]|nr:hypothetical protein [Acidobacteriota bacterium]